MKFYKGKRVNNIFKVTKASGGLLDPRLDLCEHSSTGFAWGHGGFGAAQLALAILADCLNDDALALRYYQKFKWQFIANIKTDSWTITESEIAGAISQYEKDG